MQQPHRTTVPPQADNNRPPDGGPADGWRRGRPGVLVVDDDHVERVIMKLCLERCGFDVWLASDGREAFRLDQAHRDRIRVVLLDVRLPGLDGPRTLHALRGLNPDVVACFISGTSGPEEPEDWRPRSDVPVISKPFLLNELASILGQLIQDVSADRLRPGGSCQPGAEPERVETTRALARSILVVDDDADTLRNMADLLGDFGYVVDAAGGGDTALEQAGRRPYSLGLLDLRIPGMDGLTLCRHLKHMCPRMVTMIITAHGASSLADQAREAGARHILPKPIDVPRLLSLIERALTSAN